LPYSLHSKQRWAPAHFSRSRTQSKKEGESAKKKERKKSESAKRERKKRKFALFPPPAGAIWEGKDHSWASLNQNLTELNVNL
jgi:hypothetical protein